MTTEERAERRAAKPVMTKGAERVLTWAYLVPLIAILVFLAVGAVVSLTR
jgi:hypothetical protein